MVSYIVCRGEGSKNKYHSNKQEIIAISSILVFDILVAIITEVLLAGFYRTHLCFIVEYSGRACWIEDRSL